MQLIKITCYASHYDAFRNIYEEKHCSQYVIVSKNDSVRSLAFKVYEDGIRKGIFSEEFVSYDALRDGPLEVNLFNNRKEKKSHQSDIKS